MRNPVALIANQFIRRSPAKLLVFGFLVSLIDFWILYAASDRDGVLYIDQGIGLFKNYGLWSTLIGNAVSMYVVKKYYDAVCSIRESDAVVDTAPIRSSLARLNLMMKMKGRYQFALYGLLAFGLSLWLWNLRAHVVDGPEVIWGHKVFDSTDHPMTFAASRLHNVLTWLIVMPLAGYIVISSSIQLSKAVAKAQSKGALIYDLLNPDQRGGFGFIDKTHIAFNVIIALIYVQITLHIVTFTKINIAHVIGYLVVTAILLGGNHLFLGGIHATVKTLRIQALNKVKDKVFNGDKLHFEILKYHYERRVSATAVVNFCIKAVAFVIPIFVKYWPTISKAIKA
jgi:hypothetical protein